MTGTHHTIPLAVCLGLAISGCVDTEKSPVEMLSNKSPIELRAMQSRAFDTTDSPRMLRTIVATLKDLGYMVQKVEPEAATVSAEKLGRLRISVSVSPRGETQMTVRANALVDMGSQRTVNQVDEPEFYQKHFFEPLAKASFLTALQTSD